MDAIKLEYYVGETWIDARVINLEAGYSKNIFWYLDDSDALGGESLDEIATESNWFTFDRLDPGTSYKITATVYYDTEWIGDITKENIFTNESDEPNPDPEPDVDGGGKALELLTSTETTLWVYVIGLDTNYSRDDRYINWYIDNGIGPQEQYLGPGWDTSDSAEFTGLSPGTQYTIRAEIRYTDNGQSKWATVYGDFETEKAATLEFFEWDSPKTEGEAFNITASEWNKLLAHINDVRSNKKLPSYDYNYIPQTGDSFLREYYNDALMAIAGIYSYEGISDIYNDNYIPYDDKIHPITADKINLLMELINDIM